MLLTTLQYKKRIARWFLVGGMLYGVGWLFWSAREVLIPFVIGLLLSYILLPVINRLHAFIPRWSAILIVYIGCMLFLIGVGAFVLPLLWFQSVELIQSIPNFTLQDIQNVINEFLGQYRSNIPVQLRRPIEEGLSHAFDSLKSNLMTYAQGIGTFIFNQVMQIINTVIFLFGLIIVPVWMFHVLNDYPNAYEPINNIIPKSLREDFWAIVKIADRLLSSYIRGQIILSFIVGSVAGLGLITLRMFGFEVKYVFLLAVIAGVTELIPVIGPVIGAVPAIIIGFFDSPLTALFVFLLYFGIQTVENTFLVPRIIGESVGIHPVFLIVLMIIAGQLFGLTGVIIIAPVSAVARDVFLYLYHRLRDDPSGPDDGHP